MLKKLDNDFSFSKAELANKAIEFIKKPDVEIIIEIEKAINLTMSYLNDDKLFTDWNEHLYQKFHSSISKKTKNECKVCNGESELYEDKKCNNIYNKVNDEVIMLFAIHNNTIENNRHLLESKEMIKSLTIMFFECFEFKKGELLFNSNKYDNTILTNFLLLLREYFANLKPVEAVNEITKAIEELETHEIICESSDRILSDFVKPQLKYLKKQRKYYEKKLKLEPLTVDKKYIEKEKLFKLNNNLIPKLNIEQVYNYFEVLTQSTNTRDEFYLNEEKLIKFIHSTFVEKEPIQQSFNVPFSRDKINVRSVFQRFLNECFKFEKNSKYVKQKYFDIMNNGFEGFNEIDFEKFHKTNNKIPTIKLYKSK